MPLLTTGAIAGEYISLCQNPLQNLPRWLAENKKPKAYRSEPPTARTIEQISSPRLAGAEGPSLEHFPAKWMPVCARKMRPNKGLEPRSDSIGTEKALENEIPCR